MVRAFNFVEYLFNFNFSPNAIFFNINWSDPHSEVAFILIECGTVLRVCTTCCDKMERLLLQIDSVFNRRIIFTMSEAIKITINTAPVGGAFQNLVPKIIV